MCTHCNGEITDLKVFASFLQGLLKIKVYGYTISLKSNGFLLKQSVQEITKLVLLYKMTEKHRGVPNHVKV